VIYGLKSKVRRAYLLADRQGLKFTQQADEKMDHYALSIELPASAPDKNDSVIVLDLQEAIEADTSLLQQPDFSVTLPAFLSETHKVGDQGLRLDTRGVVERWVNKDEWLNWDFKVSHPGAFEVVLLSSEQKYGRDWEGGHTVEIEVAGQKLKGQVDNNGKQENPANPYWKYVISKIGQVRIDKAGKYTLNLKPETIRAEKKLGLTLVSVELRPVQKAP